MGLEFELPEEHCGSLLRVDRLTAQIAKAYLSWS
jgi:hypothetical protein